MDKIRVLLADDHALFREGLRSLLEEQEGIEIVGEAEDGLEAIKLAAKLKPSVVLMDINMPVVDGVQATHSILKKNKAVGIIILTMYPQDEYVFEALKAGAKAYLLKDTRSKKLLEVIGKVHEGQTAIDAELTDRLLDEFRRLASEKESYSPAGPSLTEQEETVLTLLAGGASNKDIAVALNLAERTIKNYMTTIFQKLRVNNRTEAAIWAIKEGLGPD